MPDGPEWVPGQRRPEAEIGEIMRTLRALAIAGALSAALMGCSRVGNPLEALGQGVPPPDEFSVVTTKPLKMPASRSLPEPRPGAKSPLEYDPKSDARKALLNEGTAAKSTGPSAGEASLLTAAKASGDKTDVKTTLAAAEARAGAGKGWEAPTLLELLSLGGRPKEDILDPDAEARRLALPAGQR